MSPHPTFSKPAKIGRKHLGLPSLRIIGKRKAGAAERERQKLEKRRAYNAAVVAYFRGERESFPKKPDFSKPLPIKYRKPKTK
jgi:hypothetical protein